MPTFTPFEIITLALQLVQVALTWRRPPRPPPPEPKADRRATSLITVLVVLAGLAVLWAWAAGWLPLLTWLLVG